MKKLVINAAILLFFSLQVKAQTADLHATSAAAGEGIAAGVRISYTIGEMLLVDTKSSNGLMITQGILQPEAGIVLNNAGGTFEPGELQVYPVPTPDNLSVRISLLQKGNMALSLYDAQGRRMISEVFSYNGFITKNYSLAAFAAGNYFLHISYDNNAGNKRKGIYTIVKTN